MLEAANIGVPLMREIRKQISQVKVPQEELDRLSAEQLGGKSWDLPVSSLLFARTGLLRPVCREHPEAAVQQVIPHLRGQIALLTSPVLSPHYLGQVLRVMERAVRSAVSDAEQNRKAVPKFTPKVGIVERTRLVDASGLPSLTKLPSRATLHAQLVGLLSMPAMQLTGMLSQASGQVLAATLDARRHDLEDANAVAKK